VTPSQNGVRWQSVTASSSTERHSMSGDAPAAATADTTPVPAWYRPLLLSGVLGPAVFVFNVVLGGLLTPGYSQIRNAVSELTEAGATNSAVINALFVLSALLLIVFGVAVAQTYRQRKRSVSWGGFLIVGVGVFAVLLATIFPQDPIGSEATLPGTMHLVLVGASALMIVGAILLVGFGLHSRPLQGPWFKVYSILTVFVMLAAGGVTPILMMNDIPLLGVFERTTQLAYLVWYAIFALLAYVEFDEPARY
jgi:hypothetical membrane protein